MADADVVFLDPDNGLGRGPRKHARITDLVALRRENRVLSIIKFPGRHKSHQDQVSDLHRDLQDSGFQDPLTVITCVHVVTRRNASVPRHRFFTIAGGDDNIRARAENYAQRLNGLARVVRVSAACVG
jgi:hypothetical protein